MTNIVWSEEQGWHDGAPATVSVDDSGRIVAEPVCPRCGRPSVGRAFGPSPLYARCANGHVFPTAVTR